MKPAVRVRRWPARNFLDEIDPGLAHVDAIEDLAHRDPALRAAYRALRRWSRRIRSQVPTADWVSFADSRVLVQTTEFELAFNLGFEAGLLAGRSGIRPVKSLAIINRFLRTQHTPQDLASILFRLACALLESPPRAAGLQRAHGAKRPPRSVDG